MSLDISPTGARARRRLLPGIGVFAGLLLVAVGVFAANDWFPKTDPMSGKRIGWFGRNADAPVRNSSAPNPTPQLSKEYIYAGSRLLAVEDANATAAPPADIAVWRPSNGFWMVMGQTGSQTTTFQFGMSGDTPVPGDYDGDGKTDFAVYRPGDPTIFYVWRSGAENYYGVGWGNSNDKAFAADFDGDGLSDPAVARHNTVTGDLDWWITTSSNSSHFAISWGAPTDIPAPADYDGDGIADVSVFRPSDENFYIVRSSDAQAMIVNIDATGTVVSSDYDGDGKADPAIFNSSTATWYIQPSTTSQTSTTVQTVVWGSAGASGCTGGNCTGIVPVHNDYDLDGKTDLAVWNNAASAVWTIKRSSNGTTRTETFGTTGDIPVPAWYRR